MIRYPIDSKYKFKFNNYYNSLSNITFCYLSQAAKQKGGKALKGGRA
jgi:hypothetical protein